MHPPHLEPNPGAIFPVKTGWILCRSTKERRRSRFSLTSPTIFRMAESSAPSAWLGHQLTHILLRYGFIPGAKLEKERSA